MAAYLTDAGSWLLHAHRTRIAPAAATRANLAEYLNLRRGTGARPASTYRLAQSLKQLYRFLSDTGDIAKDPARDLACPKLRPQLPTYITPEQVDAILATVPRGCFNHDRFKAMLELGFATGMRVHEITELRLVDLALPQVLINGKGGKQRRNPVHARACAELRHYLASRARLFPTAAADLVFLNKNGAHMSRQWFGQELKHWAARAGLATRVHPHILRHGFATAMLNRGAGLRDVQELLGHANLNTTQVYTHVDPAGLAERYQRTHPAAAPAPWPPRQQRP